MILVDTSVWVDHLRSGNDRLRSLLTDEAVFCHPFVIGEIACGSLRSRHEVLGLLAGLPMCPVASHHDVMHFVGTRRLHGRGIGWIDAHLVTAAFHAQTQLWTQDKRLRTIAEELKIAAPRS